MKTSKLAVGVLFLLLVCSVFGFATAGWRTINYALRMQLPLHALWFGVKTICFAGIVAIGLSLLRLFRQYTQQGYFDNRSVSIVRFIGLVTVGVALANSFLHGLTNQVISVHATALPPLKNMVGNLLADLLYESPILLFFSLLVFLFASFMGKAIEVKHEAEAYI